MDGHIEVNSNLIRNGVQALQHNVIGNTPASALHTAVLWSEILQAYVKNSVLKLLSCDC